MNRIAHKEKLEFLTRAIDAVAEVWVALQDQRERYVFARLVLIYLHEFLIHAHELNNQCNQEAVSSINEDANKRDRGARVKAASNSAKNIREKIADLEAFYNGPLKALRHGLAAHKQNLDFRNNPIDLEKLFESWHALGEYSLLELQTKVRNIYAKFAELGAVKSFKNWYNDKPILAYVKSRKPIDDDNLIDLSVYKSLRKEIIITAPKDKTGEKEQRILTACIELGIVSSLMLGFSRFIPPDGIFGENAEENLFMVAYFSVWALFIVDLCSLITNLLPSLNPNPLDPPLSKLWIDKGHLGGYVLNALPRRDVALEDKIKQARNKAFAHLEKSEDVQSIVSRFSAFAENDLDRNTQVYAQHLVKAFCLGCEADPGTRYLLRQGEVNK